MSRRLSRTDCLVLLAAAAVGGLAAASVHVWAVPWLDPGSERSPFSWLAAAAAIGAAAAAASLAREGRRAPRLALAMLLCLIALDEAVGLHERFAADLDARRVAVTWPTVGFGLETLLLLGTGLLLALEVRRGSALGVAAGVALLAAALSMRLGGGALAALHRLPQGALRHDGMAISHGLAVTGWILVAIGLIGRATGLSDRSRGASAAVGGQAAESATQSRVR